MPRLALLRAQHASQCACGGGLAGSGGYVEGTAAGVCGGERDGDREREGEKRGGGGSIGGGKQNFRAAEEQGRGGCAAGICAVCAGQGEGCRVGGKRKGVGVRR